MDKYSLWALFLLTIKKNNEANMSPTSSHIFNHSG
jgi:hypothetical protein